MRVIGTIILLCFGIHINAQDTTYDEGKVTFISGENVYVRFSKTDKIAVGDTIYLRIGSIYTPCLIVNNKSSSSTVNTIIGGCNIQQDMIAYHKVLTQVIPDKKSNEVVKDVVPLLDDNEVIDVNDVNSEEIIKSKVNARISAATYSNLTTLASGNRHRTMLRANLNMANINGSRFSFESYLNYRKNFIESNVPTGYQTSFLNVYNFALSYAVDSLSWVSLGRKINRNAASIGPVDGLMGEKHFGKLYVGGIAGFKPDIVSFGLNTDLTEYGLYAGWQYKNGSNYSQTTLGVLQQNNLGNIDRRYAYFQHSSQPIRNVFLFSSIELDVYQQVGNVVTFTPRLTNFFTSLRYRISRKLTATVSYDSRRRVIFYESLRTDVEELLADDQARQGWRIRLNFSPFKYVNGGISYNKRFQNNQLNNADNYNGYLTYGKVPLVGGRLTFNFNYNLSNYLTSNIYSIQYSNALINKILNMDLYYRNAGYAYGVGETKSIQHFYGISLSTKLSKTITFGLLTELSRRSDQQNIRINTRAIKRF